MKVEELEKYGAKLEMPKEAMKKQSKIMMRALRGKFGVWGMLSIFADTFFLQRRLKKEVITRVRVSKSQRLGMQRLSGKNLENIGITCPSRGCNGSFPNLLATVYCVSKHRMSNMLCMDAYLVRSPRFQPEGD